MSQFSKNFASGTFKYKTLCIFVTLGVSIWFSYNFIYKPAHTKWERSTFLLNNAKEQHEKISPSAFISEEQKRSFDKINQEIAELDKALAKRGIGAISEEQFISLLEQFSRKLPGINLVEINPPAKKGTVGKVESVNEIGFARQQLLMRFNGDFNAVLLLLKNLKSSDLPFSLSQTSVDNSTYPLLTLNLTLDYYVRPRGENVIATE